MPGTSPVMCLTVRVVPMRALLSSRCRRCSVKRRLSRLRSPVGNVKPTQIGVRLRFANGSTCFSPVTGDTAGANRSGPDTKNRFSTSAMMSKLRFRYFLPGRTTS